MDMRSFTRLTNAFAKTSRIVHRTVWVSPAMAPGMTDRPWEIGDIVAPVEANRPPHPCSVSVRRVLDSFKSVGCSNQLNSMDAFTGCQWRAVPKDLPPRSTLFDYLDLWSYDGTLDRIHHALYMECREQAEREASPTNVVFELKN
jgi:hypothetical protein